MLCPICRSEDTQVKDSRLSEDGTSLFVAVANVQNVRRDSQPLKGFSFAKYLYLNVTGEKCPLAGKSWSVLLISRCASVLCMKMMW